MRGAPRRDAAPPPLAHPALQRRSGNTITVRPRRGVGSEGGSPAVPPPTPPVPNPGPPKKRYPTAEEIQVIGGYLALPRSCLAKNDPHRKKLKIWFSERDLERTFSYPSEGALLAAWGPPPEEPQTPPLGPPTAPDEDEEEEEPPPGRGLQGGLRARALLVDESCRR